MKTLYEKLKAAFIAFMNAILTDDVVLEEENEEENEEEDEVDND